MGSTKDFKRRTLPFDKPVPIDKKSREQLVNSVGYIRAVLDNGVVIVQAKKHKDKRRELVRININASPPTIEFTIEREEE
jgi:hypothetical protein